MSATLLLPRNRTPFETAIEQVNAERFPLPTALVKSVWSPDDCPADLLGYLAEQLSVDVWDDNWPEVKKREVCRNALLLHRLKTTPAGIKAHVALTGAEVKRLIRPPARQHLRGALTEEERLAWLDTLPQVRIYPFAYQSFVKSRHFANGKGVRKQFHSARPPRSFTIGILDEDGNPIYGFDAYARVTDDPLVVHGFLRSSRGRSMYGKRATFYDRGEETEVTFSGEASDVVQRVMLRSTRLNREWHAYGHAGQGYLTTSNAEENVVTIRVAEGGQAFAITKGVQPVDVRPKRVAQPRIAPDPRSFFGRHSTEPKRRFLRATYAPLLIYDRIALNDPERVGQLRKVRSHHGFGRFGIEPYTAELRIHVPMLRQRRTSGRWHGVGYRRAASMAPLHKAIESVRVSKAFRDTVMIDTATHGRVKFAGGLRFGEFFFGEIKEVV